MKKIAKLVLIITAIIALIALFLLLTRSLYINNVSAG